MSVEPRLSLFIGGEWLGAQGRRTLPVIDPATGQAFADLPCASPEDLDRALQSAADAFKRWRVTSAAERGTILKKAAEIMRSRVETAVPLLTAEQGKPLAEARMELGAAADILDWMANEGQRAYGRIIPSRQAGGRQTVLKEPVGVVAAFSPWNFPAATPIRKIAASLAAGCSCILKPSEETPATALEIARAFHDAGLPPGVLNVVFGVPDEISTHLIKSDVVRKISFTGSTAVGKHLLTLAAAGIKRTTMELGGHAPFIVFDDVDVTKVARLAAGSKFRNAGQVCTAPTRFLVHERVYHEFCDRFVEAAQALRIGDGRAPDTTMGPLSNERRLRAMERLIGNATAGGAKLLAGGNAARGQGFFWAPTVLADLAPTALCLKEEVFGPVAIIVPFGSEEAAIEQANAVSYGLAAYAFTSNADRVIRLSETIETGMLGINSLAITLPETPLGGVKESGFGLEGGIEGLDSYMATKFVAQAPSM